MSVSLIKNVTSSSHIKWRFEVFFLSMCAIRSTQFEHARGLHAQDIILTAITIQTFLKK